MSIDTRLSRARLGVAFTVCTLAAALAAASAAGAELSVPAPPQQQPILLEGGTIHTVSGASIEAGRLLFAEGRILAVAGPDEALELPEGTQRVDLAGRHVYPGLISANTVLGLVEVDTVRGTVDVAETGVMNPNVRAEVAVNPASELFGVTRAAGILTALTVPQAGRDGLLGGRSALLRLDGWTWEDMTLQSGVGMHVFWPTERAAGFGAVGVDSPEARRRAAEARVDQLDEFFARARAYREARAADPALPRDLRLEALAPVLSREMPLVVHADELRQIEAALNFVERHALRLVLVGGYDAWRLTERLRELDAAVIVSSVHRLPLRRHEPFDTPFVLPLKLHEAGVPFAIARVATTFASAHERNLPFEAATAAAFGLPREEALRAITLYPAQIFGVDDRIGALAPGLQATLIVTDGDPLEITTQVERAWIDGREIDLASRHTRLYERYRQRYEGPAAVQEARP
ncbi:MAG: amidohydrolase family protein [Gammaproteobacteria bacterium]|nr:amidohydrolase family protein [Gammaproteobacteria bacterium]